MSRPTVRLALPGDAVVNAGPDEIVGRSASAGIRIDDPRVSTVHAELSWRAGGFVLLARGGRLVVGGRGVREVRLEPGLEVELAPNLPIRVLDLCSGSAPEIPPTLGRELLRFRVGSTVTIHSGAAEVATLTGLGARIVATLLEHRDGLEWDEVAMRVWPEEGVVRRATAAGTAGTEGWTEVDERRLRNRLDQQLLLLRRQLSEVRGGLVALLRGRLSIVREDGDVVER